MPSVMTDGTVAALKGSGPLCERCEETAIN